MLCLLLYVLIIHDMMKENCGKEFCYANRQCYRYALSAGVEIRF